MTCGSLSLSHLSATTCPPVPQLDVNAAYHALVVQRIKTIGLHHKAAGYTLIGASSSRLRGDLWDSNFLMSALSPPPLQIAFIVQFRRKIDCSICMHPAVPLKMLTRTPYSGSPCHYTSSVTPSWPNCDPVALEHPAIGPNVPLGEKNARELL